MYYTIYKTTNIINNKIYIGYHKTKDLNDSYLGSGKHLKRAIKKYGINNFIKEILFVFKDKKEALLKEAELVNLDFINDNSNYNLKLGGEGGWDYIDKMKMEDLDFKNDLSKKISDGVLEAYKKGKLKGWPSNFKCLNKGKKRKPMSEATKKSISESQGMSDVKIDKRKYLIINSNVNFNKIGWVQKISEIIKISPQKVNIWMKKHMEEFYKECYKRKSNYLDVGP